MLHPHCNPIKYASGAQPARNLVIVCAKKQLKKKKASSAPIDQRLGYEGVVPELPAAPQPSVDSSFEEASDPAQVYPVFTPLPKPPPKQGSWSWDENQPSQPPQPAWNPKTGFMRTRADLVKQEQAAAGQDKNTQSTQNTYVSAQLDAPLVAGKYSPSVDLLGPVGAEGEDLPQVSKQQVLTSCVGTCLSLGVIGLVLRSYAEQGASRVLGTDPELLAALLRWPSGLESLTNAAVMVGLVVAVTGGRLALMGVWPEFADATDKSNKQILTPLNWLDIAFVAVLTGVSEEVLFRSGLIPGSFPDYRGALLSGLIFGILHNTGGRNLAFAAWASAVGCLYGGAYLFTQNIWVAAGAHSLSNFSSAVIWKLRKQPGAVTGDAAKQ